jgi:succinate-semialdehyde dehydrogenase / glutarate-semialdehyde dehydrogenase
MTDARLFVGGEWVDGESTATVADKYSGAPVTTVHRASAAQVAAATRAVAAAQRDGVPTPYERYEILATASALLTERRAELVSIIVADSGFTVTDAGREVDRAAQTLLLCGEEAKRIHGEVVPLDGAPGVRDRLAFTTRHPLGVVCAITPFNSPLNTVAHKVGPAIAAGNGIVLKPATYTPLTADALVRILLEAGLPPGLVALLHGGGGTVGQWLLEDDVPSFYAFTGSTEVGARIRATVGLRRSQLELGSLSSTIVCDDADLADAIGKVVPAAFRKSGQVCTSVQRLYVDRRVVGDVLDALAADLKSRVAGDPRQPDTFVGPLISAGEADRVHSWVTAARGGGATVVSGGARDGAVVEPTVLTDVDPAMTVMCAEVFGPVLAVRPFDTLDEAVAEVNDTPFGLAAGIFTRDLDRALTAAARLRMGSVHVNETSSSRVDLMPYTGVKNSGMGREGPRYAIEEMTEERLVTIGRSVR